MRSEARVRRVALTVCALDRGCAALVAGCSCAVLRQVSRRRRHADAVRERAAIGRRRADSGQGRARRRAAGFPAVRRQGRQLHARFVALSGRQGLRQRPRAIEDTSAIAYLGELIPACRRTRSGSPTPQDLLQVTPTDTAAALTQVTPGGPGLARPLLRVAGHLRAHVRPGRPDDRAEAKAQVQEMQALHVSEAVRRPTTAASTGARSPRRSQGRRVGGIDHDRSSVLGRRRGLLRRRARQRAARAGCSTRRRPASPARSCSALGARQRRLRRRLAPAARNAVRLVARASCPRTCTPTAKSQFVKPFEAAYRRRPVAAGDLRLRGDVGGALGAAPGRDLGERPRDRRPGLLRDLRTANSVLGTYSINANGDTSLAPFVFSRVVAGKLVPFKSVQPQG